MLGATGRNADAGSGDLFVAEADESDGAFLVYHPYAAVVTNVDADHLDVWGSEEAYRAAFTEFVATIDPEGFVVLCADDPGAAALVEVARARDLAVVTVGLDATCDVVASGLTFEGSQSTFAVSDGGVDLGRVVLQVPGRHYVLDALAALALGLAARAPVRRAARRVGGLHRHGPSDGAQGRGRGSARLRLLRPPPGRDRG